MSQQQQKPLSNTQQKYYNSSAWESMSTRGQQQQSLKKVVVEEQPQTSNAPMMESQSVQYGQMSPPPQSSVFSTISSSISNLWSSNTSPPPPPPFALQQQLQSNYQQQSYIPFSSSSQSIQKTQYVAEDGTVFDEHGNQATDDYDLGKDGAFSDFSIVCGIFYYEVMSSWEQNAGAALKKKGFRVTVTSNEQEFIKYLQKKEHDVALIVSNNTNNSGLAAEFKQAVLEFHKDKRGLFIFGDNDPYYAHANLVLPSLADTKLVGNNPGGKVLDFGKPTTKGQFDENHMIFAGINKLFEGITICYPNTVSGLQVLATGTDGQACIACKERSDNGGRIVIDSGFTKLYINWQSAGQARYMINATVYLVDIEGRFGDSDATTTTTKENS